MTQTWQDVQRWRINAEEIRTRYETSQHPADRSTMERLAQAYDTMADELTERLIRKKLEDLSEGLIRQELAARPSLELARYFVAEGQHILALQQLVIIQLRLAGNNKLLQAGMSLLDAMEQSQHIFEEHLADIEVPPRERGGSEN